MSVKIWDSASQAFTEPQNVPRRYDTESGAWADTTGKAYSQTDAAWEEKWSATSDYMNNPYSTILYHFGDECEEVTGGWEKCYYYSPSLSDNWNKFSDHLGCGGTGSVSSNWRLSNMFNPYPYKGGFTLTSLSATICRDYTRFRGHLAASTQNMGLYPPVIDLKFSNDDNGDRKSRYYYGSNYVHQSYIIGANSNNNFYFGMYQNWDTYTNGVYDIYSVVMCKEDQFSQLGYGSDELSVINTHASDILNSQSFVDIMLDGCTGMFMFTALSNGTFINALKQSAYYEKIKSHKIWGYWLDLLGI